MEPEEKSTNFEEMAQAREIDAAVHSGQKWDILGERILTLSRQELFLSMRYLFTALHQFRFCADRQIPFIATDGRQLFYNPLLLTQKYKESPVLVNRAYMHVLLHCLFRNIYPEPDVEQEIWNAACDIQTEYLLDSMENECLLWPESERKSSVYRMIQTECKVMSAQAVYDWLRRLPEADRNRYLSDSLFIVDDHRYWYHQQNKEEQKEQQQDRQQDNRNWEQTARKMQTELQTFGNGMGSSRGELARMLRISSHRQLSFRDFLRKFATRREVMHVDMDAFDYGFYSYGMRLYGNMPLIEELEYREESRIEDFVIVLDTSGSCAADLIQRFLDTTFAVLNEQDSFFATMRLHVIQCDNRVQQDLVLHNKEEMQQLLKDFQIKGYGGTDFRPAFRYVQELRNRHQLEHLRGMLYFTDGYGVYPAERPEWKTAFIFLGEYDGRHKVPGWAMQVNLSEQQLQERNEKNGH